MFNNGFGLYSPVAKQGIFTALKSKFNWSAILTNTQKTLNIVNQAIPLVYQVRPIVDNAKTVFKIMNAIKTERPPSRNSSIISNANTTVPPTKTELNIIDINNSSNSNAPNFFI